MRYYGPMSPLGCGRTARRGCGCLVGLLVILVLLACVLGYGVSRGVGRSAHAEGPASVTVTQLAPAVPEGPRLNQVRGVFYDAHVSVTIAAWQIRLAGSADGAGQLCTDDQATLTFRSVSGDTFVWRHTFHQSAQSGIYCIPPVDLTGQLTPGIYDVEVQLEDVVPYTYSSTAYYLVVLPEAMATATPSATPTPGSPEPTATPAITVGGPGPGDGMSGLAWWELMGLAGAALVGLAAAAVSHQRRGQVSTGPYLSGTVDLTDAETGESRRVGLFPYLRGARITRRPLGLAGLAAQVAGGQTVAYLIPSAQGPLLYLSLPRVSPPTVDASATPLQPGHSYGVAGGVVEVRYQPLDQARTSGSIRRAHGRASKN